MSTYVYHDLYRHDLYRLTSVTYPGPATTTYAFDAFGNRTSMTEPGNQATTTPPGASVLGIGTP